MKAPSSILITGGSSGIGAALAGCYAADGVRLALSGHDRTRLDAVAAACRAQGAEVETAILDVADADVTGQWVRDADDARPLDLVIANAGIAGGGDSGVGRGVTATKRILAVNVDGVINTVTPALERMLARRAGQIAIMSSLAAFRGMPAAPAYCASKAAVRSWGEALRARHARDGVAINVICPGFVKSRITDKNQFPMPLLMETARAAEIMRRGLAANKARIAFPLRMYWAAWLLGALPPGLVDGMLSRMPSKE
ncbi:MAG: SDR family NAD(P)-dependent oxidoreductase [Alphaproteobacteria bacterium]